jgi:hypothetical protein
LQRIPAICFDLSLDVSASPQRIDAGKRIKRRQIFDFYLKIQRIIRIIKILQMNMPAERAVCYRTF